MWNRSYEFPLLIFFCDILHTYLWNLSLVSYKYRTDSCHWYSCNMKWEDGNWHEALEPVATQIMECSILISLCLPFSPCHYHTPPLLLSYPFSHISSCSSHSNPSPSYISNPSSPSPVCPISHPSLSSHPTPPSFPLCLYPPPHFRSLPTSTCALVTSVKVNHPQLAPFPSASIPPSLSLSTHIHLCTGDICQGEPPSTGSFPLCLYPPPHFLSLPTSTCALVTSVKVNHPQLAPFPSASIPPHFLSLPTSTCALVTSVKVNHPQLAPFPSASIPPPHFLSLPTSTCALVTSVKVNHPQLVPFPSASIPPSLSLSTHIHLCTGDICQGEPPSTGSCLMTCLFLESDTVCFVNNWIMCALNHSSAM